MLYTYDIPICRQPVKSLLSRKTSLPFIPTPRRREFTGCLTNEGSAPLQEIWDGTTGHSAGALKLDLWAFRLRWPRCQSFRVSQFTVSYAYISHKSAGCLALMIKGASTPLAGAFLQWFGAAPMPPLIMSAPGSDRYCCDRRLIIRLSVCKQGNSKSWVDCPETGGIRRLRTREELITFLKS